MAGFAPLVPPNTVSSPAARGRAPETRGRSASLPGDVRPLWPAAASQGSEAGTLRQPSPRGEALRPAPQPPRLPRHRVPVRERCPGCPTAIPSHPQERLRDNVELGAGLRPCVLAPAPLPHSWPTFRVHRQTSASSWLETEQHGPLWRVYEWSIASIFASSVNRVSES